MARLLLWRCRGHVPGAVINFADTISGKRLRLRWWLTVLVLATAVPMIGLLAYNVHREAQLAIDRAQRLSVSMAEVGVNQTLAFLESHEKVLATLAERPLVRAMDPAQCDPSFQVILGLRPYLANVATVDRNGLSVCTVVKLPDGSRRNIGQPAWLLELLQRKGFVAGKVQKGIYTGRLILVLAYPVRDAQGEVSGAVEFVVNLTAFNPSVPQALSSGMVTSLVDSDGTVIARSVDQDTTVGKNLRDLPLFRAIEARGLGVTTSQGVDGVERVYAYAPVGGTGWTVTAGSRTDTIYAEVLVNARYTGLLALLVVLTSAGLVWYTTRRVSEPVNALLHAVHGIADGQFDARAPVEGPLEIANVASAFNAMLDQLQAVEEKLQVSENHYRMLFDTSPDAIRVVCGDRVVMLNAAGMKLFGADSPTGLTDKLIHELVDVELREAVHERLRAAIEDNRSSPLMEQTLNRPDGTRVHVEAITTPFVYQGQQAALSLIRDITQRKLAESALRESEARYARVIEGSAEGFWDWDIPGHVFKVSRRFEEILGYEPGGWQVEPSDWWSHVHPDELDMVVSSLHTHLKGYSAIHEVEMRLKTAQGDWLWVSLRGKAVRRNEEGRALIMSGTLMDISQRKQADALIWRQANTDALTGLPNRRLLRDRLDQAIQQCQRTGARMAVLFLDLDLFKEVNDTLGHDQGDVLLVEAARRISAAVGPSATVARQGGDEFTVVIPDVQNTEEIETIALRLIQSFSGAFKLGFDQVFITASVGITLFPDDASDVEGLLKRADQAMYAAKAAGRNRFSYFTPALQESSQYRLRLTNDLRSALTRDEFSVYYQPIVNFADGSLHKAEALIRWAHPTRGMVSPAAFIPLAESSGLIVEIGDWVFKQAAAQAKAWREAHHPDFQISVNKSPMQFADGGDGHRRWKQHLSELGLPGEALVVEITEGMLLASRQDVRERLIELRRMGLGVSLDDFGTGYSSLSYLQKYDIDFVKIDQSFVRNLVPGGKDMALCKAIIVMAHELGMKVIAEGVETHEQHALLAAAGCDFGQGYLFSKPIPVQAFNTLLANWQPVLP